MILLILLILLILYDDINSDVFQDLRDQDLINIHSTENRFEINKYKS